MECKHHDELTELIKKGNDQVNGKLDEIDRALRGSQDGEVQGLVGRVRTIECENKRNRKIRMAALVAFVAVIVQSGWNWITSK